MSNVQDFTLTNRKPKEPVYALIIISNVHLTGGQGGDDSHMTYMIDKVGMIPSSEDVPMIRNLLRKLEQTSGASSRSAPTKQEAGFREDQTPYSAKKARRLCNTPTDATLPSP